jgi:hypothetical protein
MDLWYVNYDLGPPLFPETKYFQVGPYEMEEALQQKADIESYAGVEKCLLSPERAHDRRFIQTS